MDTWNIEYLECGVWLCLNEHPDFISYYPNPFHSLKEALEFASYVCEFLPEEKIQIICPDNTII